MKKYMLVMAILGIMPVLGASGYEYNKNTNQYATTTRSTGTKSYKKTSTVRKTGGYHNTITNNFYYGGQPVQQQRPVVVSEQRQAAPIVRQEPVYDEDVVFVEDERPFEEQPVVQVKPERSSQERKYFLAHPFFQPLKGKVGSVTDVSYAHNDFKFDIIDGRVLDIDPGSLTYGDWVEGPVGISGKAENNQFLVKEDLSIGLTDSLALMLMAQYDSTKVKFKDWSGGEAANESSDSGLNVFGVGLQSRFLDNDEWIAMLNGFFQHQKDTANTLVLDVKAGYKFNRTTAYGLVRLGYSDLIDGDIYGSIVKDSSGDWLMLSYKQDVKDVFYVEGGAGFFSVLNKYTYLNGELIYGYYDWHNQLSIKGVFGVQPTESFAINLYASMALYDSAKGKTKGYMNYDVNPDPVLDSSNNPVLSSQLFYTTGDYKINSYNEWKLGVQAILYF